MNRQKLIQGVQIGVALALLVALVGVIYFVLHRSWSKPAEPVQNEPQEDRILFHHPLTGVLNEQQEDFFVVSVLYDNFEDVRVHYGLEQAAIVYEAIAEGGITRLLAIFDSRVAPEKIGPIRSVRPYFLDWASEYGGVLMHVGGSPEALTRLDHTDAVLDIDQIGAHEQYFFRDERYEAPHNVFSDNSSWLQIAERYEISNSDIRAWKYAECDESLPAPTSQQLQISFFPDNNVAWVYDADAQTYLRFVNGTRQLHESGEQIYADNIIVIEVKSEIIDALGRQHLTTIGSGPALIITHGEYQEAQWIKSSIESRILFLNKNQEEVALQPGTVWIEVVGDMEMVDHELIS